MGATLPADVRLTAVPADWGPSVTKYQYVYSDNHVYFVEPSTRKAVSYTHLTLPTILRV